MSQAPAEEPQTAPEAEPETKTVSRRSSGHRGRGSLPAHLPREEICLQPIEEQLAANSGGMTKMSEERSEVLEYEPARFKVLVYAREVWSNAQGEIVAETVRPTSLLGKAITYATNHWSALCRPLEDDPPRAQQR